MKHIDLTGKRFGRWLVLEHQGQYEPGNPLRGTIWKCQCDCGTIRDKVRYGALASGRSNSCGCLRVDLMTAKGQPIGPTAYPSEYHIWQGIKTRCLNRNHPSFQHYGARGITICPQWEASFRSFFTDMGPRPTPSASIDRIDNAGNYEPTNCRWATRQEQASNTRRNRLFEWGGKQMNLTEICRLENVRYANMYQRLFTVGATIEDAINYCRAEGLTFFERMGTPDARLTLARRNRQSPHQG